MYRNSDFVKKNFSKFISRSIFKLIKAQIRFPSCVFSEDANNFGADGIPVKWFQVLFFFFFGFLSNEINSPSEPSS